MLSMRAIGNETNGMEKKEKQQPFTHLSLEAWLKYTTIEKRKKITKNIPAVRGISRRAPFYFDKVFIRLHETGRYRSFYFFQTEACEYRLEQFGDGKKFNFYIFPNYDYGELEKRALVLKSDWILETMARCFTNFYFNRRGNVFRELSLEDRMTPYDQMYLPTCSLFEVQMPIIRELIVYLDHNRFNAALVVAKINKIRADMTRVMVVNSGGMHPLFGLTASHLGIEDLNSSASSFVAHCNNFVAKQYVLGSYYKACYILGLLNYIDFFQYVFDNLENAEKAELIDCKQVNKIVKCCCEVMPFCIRVPMNETSVLNICYMHNSAIAAVMPQESSVPCPLPTVRHYKKVIMVVMAGLSLLSVLIILLNFIHVIINI